MRKLIFLCAVLCAQPVLAAPFCVQTQAVPAQCDYFDAAQCRTRAGQLAGECVANPRELTVKQGVGKFCVVDSSRVALCSYDDRITCDNDALKLNGVCIEANGDAIQQDPFQKDPNRKY